MLTVIEKSIFLILTIAMFYLTFRSFHTMIKIINRGQDRLYFNHILSRLQKALSVLVLQNTVLKSRPILSMLHSLIAWAFILYMFVNIGGHQNPAREDRPHAGAGRDRGAGRARDSPRRGRERARCRR